jgi:hypothetical protein
MQNEFSIKIVKACVRELYGSTPSRTAWGNWKKWAQVPTYDRWVRMENFTKLVAIASARKEFPSQELDWMLHVEPRKKAAAAAIEKYMIELDDKTILGRDIPAWLKEEGCRPMTEAQLYKSRKIKYGKATLYPLNQLVMAFI